MTTVTEEQLKTLAEDRLDESVSLNASMDNWWFVTVKLLVQPLTLGRCRLEERNRHPVEWDGIIR